MYKYKIMKQGLTFALASLKAVKYQAAALLVFAVLQGASPALVIYTTQLLIDAFLTTEYMVSRDLLIIFLIWLFSVSIGVFLNPWTTLLHANISEIMSEKLQVNLMSLISGQNNQGVMEEPKVIDDIHFIKSQIEFRPLNFILMLANTLKDSISIVGIMIVLVNINVLAPLILMTALIPHAYISVKTKEREWLTKREHGTNLKKMYYLFDHALDSKTHLERRVFQANDFIIKKHQSTFFEMHRKLKQIRIKAALYPMLTLALALLGVIFTSWIVVSQSGSLITPGNVAAILFSFVMLQQTAESTIRDQVDLAQTLNYFHVFGTLERKLCESVKGHQDMGSIPVDRIQKVEFKDVSFTYPDGTRALNNVSFTGHKGEKIAIIGKNGSGKSTLVKLLLGSYRPSSGIISINDKPIADAWASSNHRIASCMTQDFGKYIFSAEENIGFGESVTDNIKSQLPFISDWESPVSPILGGFNLSGGQWQQLALLRALFKAKSLYVFDEPTSSIDPVLESSIVDTLVNTPSDLTLIVTHRLGAVSRVDKILLLDEGRIVAKGTHEKLMANSRDYRNIYLSQTGMYKQ